MSVSHLGVWVADGLEKFFPVVIPVAYDIRLLYKPEKHSFHSTESGRRQNV